MRAAALSPRLIVSACGGDEDVPGSKYRDLAAPAVITIEPASFDALPKLELSAHPVLMIGGHYADPDAALLQPIAATLSDDGRIAVADAMTKNVRVFGGDGKLLQTFGHG